MAQLLGHRMLLGAYAAALAGCSNGIGGALPFAGPPNNAGGTPGTFQGGGKSTALLRFVQGSPDYAAVDVCIDDQPFGITAPTISYGAASAALYAIPGGITHTISTYPSLGGTSIGLECATAPGPYLGTAPISVTTLGPGTSGNPARETIVLAGTAASATLGLYVFGEPSFAATPGSEAISHNAAPAFSAAQPVGFGFVPVGGAPTNLAGAQSVAAPLRSPVSPASVNANVVSPLAAVPASFYDGAGTTSGTVVPVSTVAAPAASSGQPYVVELYAIDAAGGGLSLVAVPEQTAGYGF